MDDRHIIFIGVKNRVEKTREESFFFAKHVSTCMIIFHAVVGKYPMPQERMDANT
jgi:hypothetical protein